MYKATKAPTKKAQPKFQQIIKPQENRESFYYFYHGFDDFVSTFIQAQRVSNFIS